MLGWGCKERGATVSTRRALQVLEASRARAPSPPLPPLTSPPTPPLHASSPQAQLALLYEAGQPGCCAEFAAYRLLYQAVRILPGCSQI